MALQTVTEHNLMTAERSKDALEEHLRCVRHTTPSALPRRHLSTRRVVAGQTHWNRAP
jgi:hypothetical protein